MSLQIRRIRVFLISLYPKDHLPFIGESQGICAISGYLQQQFPNDVNVKLYDQQLDSNESVIEDIVAERPDIIGFSLKMGTLDNFEVFYNAIKLATVYSTTYNPIIVLGNSIANFDGDYLLKRYPDVLISFGEGELTFEDIILYVKFRIPKDKIRNSKWIENGIVHASPKYYLNGDIFPIADRRYTSSYYKSGGEVYIEGSRGCAYCACSICECRDLLGSYKSETRWRPRPLESIILELKLLQVQGIKLVTFSDEDFIGPNNIGFLHALSLSKAMIDEGIQIKYRVNLRVKSIADHNDDGVVVAQKLDLLSKLKKSGLVKVFLGFESGSESQLRRYNKGFSLDDFLKAKATLEKLDIDYELGFISFDPLMNLNELKTTLEFINDTKCLTHISSVFKELRIQSGNKSYLEQVRRFERDNDTQLIGELDHHLQLYPILKYADQRIDFLASIMREIEQETYKRYYSLRLKTQYAQTSDAAILNDNSFENIAKVKQFTYRYLTSFIKLLELDIYSLPEIQSLKEHYRRDVLNCLGIA